MSRRRWPRRDEFQRHLRSKSPSQWTVRRRISSCERERRPSATPCQRASALTPTCASMRGSAMHASDRRAYRRRYPRNGNSAIPLNGKKTRHCFMSFRSGGIKPEGRGSGRGRLHPDRDETKHAPRLSRLCHASSDESSIAHSTCDFPALRAPDATMRCRVKWL